MRAMEIANTSAKNLGKGIENEKGKERLIEGMENGKRGEK